MFMWRSAPESWSFTQLVSQAVSKIDTKASLRPLDGLREAVLASAEELAGRSPIGGGLADRRGAIALERPPRADFGDYSTNAALLLAPGLGAAPREVAQPLGEALQARKLGESVLALARGEAVAEDGYRGDYVERLVHLVKTDAIDPAELGRAAVTVMVGEMQASLAAFAVHGFDRWAYESALHEGDPSRVTHALSILQQQGHTYQSEGALWLRTTDYGDDKDRVLVRSSGEHTYFASDIAYHQDKRERGFDRQIDVWGADHHGYVARMKAAYAALGGDPEQLELLIMQLVHLVRRGERAQMSKRAGEFVTLDELLEEIGVDATRWYLLARSHDTTVDLDLDLAREQSSENPVYYVQYAHARIASMLAKAGEERVRAALAEVEGEYGPGVAGPLNGNGAHDVAGAPEGATSLDPAERALIKQLLAFPAEIAEAAERRAPHRIAAYALELAQSFTALYRDCHVLGAEPEAVESLRIALCVASRRTIARSLDLLGVSAPEQM